VNDDTEVHLAPVVPIHSSPYDSMFAMTLSRTLFHPVLAATLVLLLVLTGCDSTGPSSDAPEVSADETAEMIAVTLAEENGGTADDVASADLYATNLQTGSKAISRSYSRDCSYSDADQLWSCDVSASRTSNRIDASFSRSVEVQFLDASGQPQRNYTEDGETAASLVYTILDGSGSFESPRMSTEHTIPASGNDASSWTIDGPGSGVLTINGAGSRETSATRTGRRGSRVRSATLTSQVSDVLLERGSGIQGGTIAGTYDAEIVLTNDAGEEFSRSISVEYEATFSNDTVEITFTGGGERFNGRSFEFSSATGEPV
jgi:hypothetical protein